MRNLASPQRYLKHGSPTTSDNTLTFDWSDVSDPSGVTYYLQIDNDVDFSSPAISENGLTLSTYTLTSGEALSDGTYFWRVRTVDGANNVGDWSDAWTLKVVTAPPKPFPWELVVGIIVVILIVIAVILLYRRKPGG